METRDVKIIPKTDPALDESAESVQSPNALHCHSLCSLRSSDAWPSRSLQFRAYRPICPVPCFFPGDSVRLPDFYRARHRSIEAASDPGDRSSGRRGLGRGNYPCSGSVEVCGIEESGLVTVAKKRQFRSSVARFRGPAEWSLEADRWSS